MSGDVGWVNGVIFGAARGLIGWAVWALVHSWLIGATMLKTPETHAEWGQLARGTGFAQTPGILTIFVFIPVIGGIITSDCFRVAIRGYDDCRPASLGLHVDLAGLLRDSDLLHCGADRSDSRVSSVGPDR